MGIILFFLFKKCNVLYAKLDEALNHSKPRNTEQSFQDEPLGNVSGGFEKFPRVEKKNHMCVFNFNHCLYLQAVVLKSRVIYFNQNFRTSGDCIEIEIIKV